MRVVIDLDGQLPRIAAARRELEGDLRGERLAWRRRALSRALDLCDQAMTMVRDSGAADDDRARRRLVVGSKHEKAVVAFWPMAEPIEQSAAELRATLQAIDDEPV